MYIRHCAYSGFRKRGRKQISLQQHTYRLPYEIMKSCVCTVHKSPGQELIYLLPSGTPLHFIAAWHKT